MCEKAKVEKITSGEQVSLERFVTQVNTVSNVKDNSDELFKRMLISFKNGYSLSVIKGEYSYGGSEGFYEIAPKNKSGALDGSLFDDEDKGDDVLGWCDEDRVKYYVNKIGNLSV